MLDKAISLHLESFFMNIELDPLEVYLGSGGYFDIVSELSSLDVSSNGDVPDSEDMPENRVEKVRTTRKYILRHGTEIPTRRPHKHNSGEEWVADVRERKRRNMTTPTHPLKPPLITYDDFLGPYDKPPKDEIYGFNFTEEGKWDGSY